MLIAFSFLSFTEPDDTENFLYEIFQSLSKKNPEHTFLFISDKNFKPASFTENVLFVEAGHQTKMPAKWAVWYQITLRKILKKNKADVLLASKFCSILTKVPQMVFSPDLYFIHQPLFFSKRENRIYKKMTPLILKKAKAIVALSQFEKDDIINRYKTDANKISVICQAANDHFLPVDTNEREFFKQKYADGNEYFIYTGIISPQKNLIKLLKGFSAFKKRQRSGMQLIIAGTAGKQYEEFAALMESYKFKKEIKLLSGLSQQELIKLTAASYAAAFPSAYETSAQTLLNTMKCQVPVLASRSNLAQEICGEGALYFNPENEKDIAEQLMLIYKDEHLRKDLVEKGRLVWPMYNNKNNVDKVRQLIDTILNAIES